MSEKKHAVLSASSAHRWLACPPSALACAGTKDTASEYAQQGTDAHSLCEYKLLTALGQKAEDPTESLSYFDEEMADCADAYAQFVQEQIEAAKQMEQSPITLQLRYLQTLREISGDKNSTTIFPLPLDLVKPFMDRFFKKDEA